MDCFSWTRCPVCFLVALVLLASACFAAYQAAFVQKLKSHLSTGCVHPKLVLTHSQQSAGSIITVTECLQFMQVLFRWVLASDAHSAI